MSKGSTRRPGTIPDGAWEQVFPKRSYPNLEKANLDTTNWREKSKDQCVHVWDPMTLICLKCTTKQEDV